MILRYKHAGISYAYVQSGEQKMKLLFMKQCDITTVIVISD